VTARERGRDTDRDVRARTRGGGGTARNVAPTDRSQRRYEPDQRIRTSPGLQVPGRGPTTGVRESGRLRSPGIDRTREATRPETRVRPGSRGDRGRDRTVTPRSRGGDERRTIRPVEPRRGDGGRVWTNRRSSGSSRVTPQPPPRRSEPRSRSDNPRVRRQERPSSPPANPRGGSSPRRVAPRKPSPPPSKPAPPPSNPRSGGGSKKKSRSSGGRG
jgi:hypothetical protein